MTRRLALKGLSHRKSLAVHEASNEEDLQNSSVAIVTFGTIEAGLRVTLL
jgi:hypothetical protein